MTTIRWGIIGTGWISEEFATDLVKFSAENTTDIQHVITQVGSSTVAKARSFAEEKLNSLQKELGAEVTDIVASGYEDLYKSDIVDIVYVGSPHVNHMENCLSAIKHKKNILCEKPVTVNAKQLHTILEAAKKNNVFFMEALWVCFFPANRKLIDLVHNQKILGDVKTVKTKYSHDVRSRNLDASHRMLNKKLGGGACLDIGVYSLTYLRMFLHPESDPLKDWQMDESKLILDNITGNPEDNVDFSCTASFSLPKYSQKGYMESTYISKSDPYELCVIEGTKGTARVKNAGFPCSWEFTIEVDGEKIVEKFENPVPGTTGFYFQAIAVGEALKAGRKDTEIASWNDSVVEMTMLDRIRFDNNYEYDADK